MEIKRRRLSPQLVLLWGVALIALPLEGWSQLLINGAGATFPFPLYSKWFDEYSKIDPSVRFNYQSIGSGGGQKQILLETVDFGASDCPMSNEGLGKARAPILHIPTVAGAVALIYNLPGNPKLRLDGFILTGIFLGRIKHWSDPLISRANPGLRLPELEIIVVHRSDGSGTTYVFSDYLSTVSPEWATRIGRRPSLRWPVGLGAKGNEGVAGQLKQLPGAIGYIELAYAKQNHLPQAELKNGSGNFVSATRESISAALENAQIPEDFRFSIVNSPGANAYPIASATWLLAYERQPNSINSVKSKKLAEFLEWALTRGETWAEKLDYTPLPEPLALRVLKTIKKLE